jgi:hypothetical protein
MQCAGGQLHRHVTVLTHFLIEQLGPMDTAWVRMLHDYLGSFSLAGAFGPWQAAQSFGVGL